MNIFSEQYDRQRKRFHYTVYPWLSIVLFITAGVVSAVYYPPFTGCAIVLAGALLGGACLAYGAVSPHRWIENLFFIAAVFPAIAVSRSYGFGLGGQFVSLLLWMGFGLTAPFWFWRRRGLAIYSSSRPDPSDDNRD